MILYIYINGSSIHTSCSSSNGIYETKYEDVQRKTLGNIDFKGSKMKGNFKYSRFNDLEQQIQIESHKINVFYLNVVYVLWIHWDYVLFLTIVNFCIFTFIFKTIWIKYSTMSKKVRLISQFFYWNIEMFFENNYYFI